LKYQLFFNSVDNLPSNIYEKIVRENGKYYIHINNQFDMYEIYRYGYKTDVKLTKDGYTLTLTKK